MNKKKLLILLFAFTCLSNSFSQTLQWRVLPNSPSGNSEFQDTYFINNNTGWAINYSGKAFFTVDGGNTWDSVFLTNAIRSVGFFDYENGIIGTLNDDSNKVLYKTTDHGMNWSAITNFQNPRPLGICGINIVNENVAYACGRWSMPARIIKTTDKGLTWLSVTVDTSMATSLVDCFFWSKDTGLVAGGYTTTGNVSGSNAVVLKTLDGGATWQRVYVSSRQFEWCWKISYRPGNTGFISIERFGSGISKILKSTNYGNQWAEIPTLTFNEEGIGFINEITGWIGGGGYPTSETTDSGANWHLAGWGLNLNRIRFINDTLAYAAADRIYKFSTETVGIKKITSIIPDKYILYQNYPNPFNPQTVIRYSLIENRFVNLKVYDALGKVVTTLVNQKLNAGSYEVEFDGANLPSGIYFYKLETENFSEVKRMILLK